MDMFYGMGVMFLLIPFNIVFMKMSKTVYQSLGMILVMLIMNLILLTLYTLGLYTEVQSLFKFVIGLVIGVMGNLTYKVHLIQEKNV
jgi:hypothetical protein